MSYASHNIIFQLSENFCSHEGCQILTTVVNDECKLLQDVKKILEKRILLDEQYAKGLQDVTANINRTLCSENAHSIAKVEMNFDK